MTWKIYIYFFFFSFFFSLEPARRKRRKNQRGKKNLERENKQTKHFSLVTKEVIIIYLPREGKKKNEDS